MTNSVVTFVMGAPVAGKGTLTKKLKSTNQPNDVILNRDTEGGSVVDLLPKMEELLKNNNSIILDNLFASVDSRAPFIALAKKYKAQVNCIWLNTSFEDAQFNFVQRAIGILGKFPTPELIKKSKHPNIFPPAVAFKYKKEFQKPTKEEGFDNIEVVEFERQKDPSFTNKALFLDYDSTLRECIGGNGKYPISKDQIKILPNRTETLKEYQKQGYLLLGVSNQSGVAKEDLTLTEAYQLFDYTNELLGVDIDYRFCPHRSAPISCYCRKPQIGIFVEFMLKYKLDRKQCAFVGDFTSDKTASERFGIQYYDQAEFFK